MTSPQAFRLRRALSVKPYRNRRYRTPYLGLLSSFLNTHSHTEPFKVKTYIRLSVSPFALLLSSTHAISGSSNKPLPARLYIISPVPSSYPTRGQTNEPTTTPPPRSTLATSATHASKNGTRMRIMLNSAPAGSSSPSFAPAPVRSGGSLVLAARQTACSSAALSLSTSPAQQRGWQPTRRVHRES